jgi:hypothetical protein
MAALVRTVFLGSALYGIVSISAAVAQAPDANWAEKMFDKLDHDFGVVARGADVRYRLQITNKYPQPVHIVGVRTSCSCTAAKPSRDLLGRGESAYIELSIDTRNHARQKEAKVTVIFDRPLFAEVNVAVKAYIRTDVVITPGEASFGPIAKGTDQERKLSIAYAGRPDWTIREVIAKNPHIAAKVVETARNGGSVSYDLIVSVNGSAPLGELREQLLLVTNDANSPQIPVLVEGRVEAEYTVTPEVVSFGNLVPGERKTMNIVVRGRRPFGIEKIESEKSAGTFEVRLPTEPRQIHVLPLTVIAPSDAGTLNEEFTVKLAGSDARVTFRAFAKIVSPTGSPVPAVSNGAAPTSTK